MSRVYEDLTDAERLIGGMHFPEKMGPTLKRFLDALQHQLDKLVLTAGILAKEAFQSDSSLGTDLDLIGGFFDIIRLAGESDADYRIRIQGFVTGFSAVTVDGIQSMFEGITSRKPRLEEDFHIRVYRSGQTPEEGGGGHFRLFFEVPRAVVHEDLLVVEPSGTYAVASHTSIVNEQTTTLSGGHNSSTTVIAVASTSDFPVNEGEEAQVLRIENEWISYTTIGSGQFEGCVRGIYESTAASHNDAVQVMEGAMNAWLEGDATSIFDYRDGRNIYLTGGPYPDWTWIHARYKVSLDEDFDELSELVAVIDQFEAMGQEYKAAGIRADIGIASIMEAWFQETRENLVMSDVIVAPSGMGFFDSVSMPAESVPHVSSAGIWDASCWDAGYWDDDGTISGDYVLQITSSE